MATDFAVIALAVGVYLETKRFPKAKLQLSKRAEVVMYIGWFAAFQAIVLYLQNFEKMGEVVFSGSAYRLTFWALNFGVAYLAGLQIGGYIGNTFKAGEQDAQYVLYLLDSVQQLGSQLLSADNSGESAEVSTDAQKEMDLNPI